MLLELFEQRKRLVLRQGTVSLVYIETFWGIYVLGGVVMYEIILYLTIILLIVLLNK